MAVASGRLALSGWYLGHVPGTSRSGDAAPTESALPRLDATQRALERDRQDPCCRSSSLQLREFPSSCATTPYEQEWQRQATIFSTFHSLHRRKSWLCIYRLCGEAEVARTTNQKSQTDIRVLGIATSPAHHKHRVRPRRGRCLGMGGCHSGPCAASLGVMVGKCNGGSPFVAS